MAVSCRLLAAHSGDSQENVPLHEESDHSRQHASFYAMQQTAVSALMTGNAFAAALNFEHCDQSYKKPRLAH